MSAAERTSQERMEAALRPFGWTCTADFWERYHSDPWVFNLANAVERLTYAAEDAAKRTAPAEDHVVDLMAALERSVAEAKVRRDGAGGGLDKDTAT